MNQVMTLFYHPARSQRRPVPHILGLTASPVVSSKHESLETIEANLNAITMTPKRNRVELETYVHIPKIAIVPFAKERAEVSDSILLGLLKAARDYDFSKDPYILELREQDDLKSRRELEKVMAKRKTFCWENLRALDLRACALHEQLGASMSRWYVKACITKFRNGTASDQAMPDLSEQERKHLLAIFDGFCPEGMDDAVGDLTVSNKVQQLLGTLQMHASNTTRGIVFVEQRVQVTALAELLARTKDTSFSIGTFVGTSASSKRKISVADLVAIKDQDKDLLAFKNGTKNLMIATNVLEEGIDVSACNLVICFDPPKNLVSFVQRRGRARQKDSHYYIFTPDDQCVDEQWTTLEAEMKQAYVDDTRRLAKNPEDDLALSARVYEIPSTQAVLTLENAKAHLYHFCSILIRDCSYVDLRPEFSADKQLGAGNTALWSASVSLPSCLDPKLRHAEYSRQWPTESLALADAAFEAYVALHEAGLVNDNLLPRVRDYVPDADQQHVDQPSIVEVSDCESSLKEIHKQGRSLWFSRSLALRHHDELVGEMRVWLPSNELPALTIDLFWNEHDVYTLTIDGTGAGWDLDAEQTSLLQSCTQLLLSTVHGNRMSGHPSDFPILFDPISNDLRQWLQQSTGAYPAAQRSQHADSLDIGLVRIKGQTGHAYILRGFEPYESSDDESQLVVTGFPKRKDFLHIVPKTNARPAHTSKQLIAEAVCLVDKLALKYAMLAAFVPLIVLSIETTLMTVELQKSLLFRVDISDVRLVHEAISAPSAREMAQTVTSNSGAHHRSFAIDYNRLEYLGDCILKHCAGLQVLAQHRTWPESYLTMERDRMVRNNNLAKCALSLGLDKYILTEPFTGKKWRPPSVGELLESKPGARQMSTKTLADVVEALIGAAFVDGGLPKALLCIEVLLGQETWHSTDECFNVLIDDLRPTKTNQLDLLQRLTGHTFEHLTLLEEAITHVSYPYNRTGLSYERLEFLGDSILDMIITPKLFAHPRKLKHWELHSLHEALVNSHFVGFCCMAYAADEDKYDIVEAPSEREAIQHVRKSTRQVHLHDFLRMGAQLATPRRQSLERFVELRAPIEEALWSGKEYPWPLLVTLSPQKFFCDLIESLLGALLIDTHGDLSICEAFVEKLGILRYMRRCLDGCIECLSPKERLGVVADRQDVNYTVSRSEDESGKKLYACKVKVGDEDIVTVQGCMHKDEAEVKAAYQACNTLESRGGFREGRMKRKFDKANVGEENEGAGAMDSDE